MKKVVLAASSFLLSTATLVAQEKIYLYPEKVAPGSKNVKTTHEIIELSKDSNVKNRMERGITEPYMTFYKAENPNGVAILMVPGGAYHVVAFDIEGGDRAKLYNENGYSVFVLNYRLPLDKHDEGAYAPLSDALRAMRIIRNRAEEFSLDKNKIGVMGSSAGGHIASLVGTKYSEKIGKKIDEIDDVDAKPNFMMLCYPVITMLDDGVHKGSRDCLLGENPKKKLKKEFSSELFVNEKTPLTFIALSQNDTFVNPFKNGMVFAQKLSEKGVPFEMHLFQDGMHGFKTEGKKVTCAQWQKISIDWLNCYVNKD